MHRTLRVLSGLILILAASPGFGQDRAPLLSVDHFVPVKSTAPAISGQTAQIYVREVVLPGVALRGRQAPDNVVLFVHGAGTPAEVSFDVPYKDYSWMAYLAHAGFDVFSMDMTGYGRSTRPTGDERSVQPLERAAGAIRAAVDRRAVCAVACRPR